MFPQPTQSNGTKIDRYMNSSISGSATDDGQSPISTLDDDFYPPCWSDNARMSVLFAPFRPKALNPENYDTKLEFWTQLIRKYCQHKGCSGFSVAELRNAFQRNSKQPYSLDTVLDELQLAGQVQTSRDFLLEPQNTWTGWAQQRIGFAWQRFAGFALRAGPKQESGSPRSAHDASSVQQFVLLDCAETHAQLLQQQADLVDRVLDLDELTVSAQVRFAAPTALSARGLRLAVHRLLCTNRAAIIRSKEPGTSGSSVTLLKIAAEGDERQPSIECEDSTMFMLERSVRRQKEQIDRLEEQRSEADRSARQLIHDQKKELAKLQLRKRKQLDVKIGKEADKLLNLESLVASIEETKHASNVIGAYRMATDALRHTHAKSGLSVDQIDDIMYDMKEILDDQREIEETVSTATDVNEKSASEATLEDELNKLIAEDILAHNESIERQMLKLKLSGVADIAENKQQINEQSFGRMLQADHY